MKKALLVLGFALCGTFAFAQTGNLNKIEKAMCRAEAPKYEARPVDYKASIFSKESVIHTFDFAAENMTGILFGDDGKVGTSGWICDGVALTPHGQTAAAQVWNRVADSADLFSNTIWSLLDNDEKEFVATYMGSAVTGNNNGYMFLEMETPTTPGAIDACIIFPAVENVAGTTTIDIRLDQCYYKYYDECFIDYKANGQWKSREINVIGVDCDVNSMCAIHASYTMPLELAAQTNIEFRIRYKSGTRGNAFGYFWAVDNVRVVSGDPDRWYTNNQRFLDGFYGTMPQGMEIPVAWYGEVVNNGSNTRTNVSVTLNHLDNTFNSDPIVSVQQDSMPANPLSINLAFVDERGFIAGEQANRPAQGTIFNPGDYTGSMLGNWWYAPTYGATSIPSSQYGLNGLPVETLGQQFFAASASSDAVDDIAWDTIAYQVVGLTGGDNDLALQGYRWSHDNGIIPSNSRYAFGYTDDGEYITQNCSRYSQQGYFVMTRYTTGDSIPTDWVFRGLEVVPQTIDPLSQIAGSEIYPMMWEIEFYGLDDEDVWGTSDVSTGSYTYEAPYTVQMSDLNDLATGRLAPSDPYHAVNFTFFNQPELKPNTSYLIGYRLAADGKFAAAKQQYSYRNAANTANIAYWRDETPEVSNGYYQFMYNDSYEVYTYDPGKGGYWATWNTEYTPMVRPVVGPRASLPSFDITAECTTGVTITDENYQTTCSNTGNGTIVGYQGGFATLYIFPEGDYSTDTTGAYKITNISIDGNVIDIDNPPAGVSITEGNYFVYDADTVNIILRRYYYAVTFDNLASTHTVSAQAVFTEYQVESGIDPVAANVNLGLQPNPATSIVKMNISGVNGMVNCSIIDMSGRVVYNANINAEQQQVIDLSNVAAGAYFVRVTNDKFSKVEKLIVR